MKTAIELIEVQKYYRNECILNNISMNIYQGEFLSVLGSSGSGKSTLLKLICGIEKLSSGKIIYNDVDISNMPIRHRHIGYVFQDYCLFQNMTVEKNIMYALSTKRLNKTDKRSLTNKMLQLVGLSDYAKKFPNELSGGQQQRVAVARTLATNQNLLLLDEPFSALDVNIKMSLQQLIKQIQSEFGTTIIYVTHDIEEAMTLSDRVAILNESELITIDTPANLLQQRGHKYVNTFISDVLYDRYTKLKEILHV